MPNVNPTNLAPIAMVSGKGQYDFDFFYGVFRHKKTGQAYCGSGGFRWWSDSTGGYDERHWKCDEVKVKEIEQIVAQADDPGEWQITNADVAMALYN